MIIKTPYVSEKASMMLDTDGKLQFIVRRDADKNKIARAVEEMFAHKVASVTTLMTMKGQKKAIVTFEDKKAGEEILSRLGIL
ncbi:50S ribosomal protein L23 [Methanogenium sp. S4BF]|uniref:50S ribosomal protein L23 n=1 Tax=Methanogenium sp. S4BF TaxID=1789226 RepID=UPI002417E5C2|nr:50S ribosomal protein L23 [Methanogenium sp. S4BF]WFN33562.1 50S ribosomal protein L23 [Methanogenium sp. S4BF]